MQKLKVKNTNQKSNLNIKIGSGLAWTILSFKGKDILKENR